ncbi:5-hydroxytryptamine receptor 4-like [Actinia tenebrosa]|uniref:5-hydroxytryptamine receptor 4-like n=1 Tax=Actinia tenebrosa TaxID=6105 RepID=A0A6P8H832_ACTTE|nr:5-hydroxytryptamine receptor 4-like [Actinia tenebrosa]
MVRPRTRCSTMSNVTDHIEAMASELASRTIVQIVFETGFHVLILLIALIGNLCVLYIFYKFPRLRKVTSYYVTTLAVSDVANAVLVMPVAVVISAVGYNVQNLISCTVIGTIGYTLVLVSLQTTTLIAINRFFCVIKPSIYRKHFKPKPAKIMIIGLWCFSLGLVLVIVASGMGNFYFHPGRFVCILAFCDRTFERVITSLMILVFVVFPIVIAVICYARIIKVVEHHKATARKRVHQESSLSKDEVEITRSLLAVVLGFIFCWIPCSVVFQLEVYMDLPREVEMIFIYSNFLSSAINPILFNVYNKPFRKLFYKIFFCKNNTVVVELAPNKPTK